MDIPKRKQYEFYNNEEDRIAARKKSKLKYSNKPWHCTICNVALTLGHKSRHLKSQKHMRKECPTCSESESEN